MCAPNPFELALRFGTRVHEVNGLRERMVYCPVTDVAFIRAGLPETECRELADALLAEALSRRRRPR